MRSLGQKPLESGLSNLCASLVAAVACIAMPTVAFAASPIGWLDHIENGTAFGWGLDPDTPAQSITINFYADGPPGLGAFIGATTADASRPDVNQATGSPG